MTNTNSNQTGHALDMGALLLGDYVDENTPAMLWGAPGIGKSDVVAQAAEARGIGFIDLRISTLDA
ncbi:MAG TPA: hypothetical protein VF627_01325, partial [Abditibacterium sp.]